MNLQALGLDIKDISKELPFRPGIIALFTAKSKGCKEWTKLLKTKLGTSAGVRERELKWERVLGVRLSIRFWDDVHKSHKLLSFDSRLKFFQYLVSRCQLQTNYIRNKYANETSDICNLCNQETETLLHLLWECPRVQSFIESVKNELRNINDLYLNDWNKRTFIFSNCEKFILRPCNIMSLYMKKYVWRMRCERRQLNHWDFIQHFKNTVQCIKLAYPTHTFLGALPDIH